MGINLLYCITVRSFSVSEMLHGFESHVHPYITFKQKKKKKKEKYWYNILVNTFVKSFILHISKSKTL